MSKMMFICRTFLTILEFATCLGALITKKLTDNLARRISKINQKFSNEWTLQSNLSWTQEGNDFSTLTYGGYTFITAVLLLARFINKNSQQKQWVEKLLLIFGIIFYLLQGCLVFASVENVPGDLHTNAFILGGLSFLAAILFLIDLCCMENTVRMKFNKTSQTDEILQPSIDTISKVIKPHTVSSTINETGMQHKPTPIIVMPNTTETEVCEKNIIKNSSGTSQRPSFINAREKFAKRCCINIKKSTQFKDIEKSAEPRLNRFFNTEV